MQAASVLFKINKTSGVAETKRPVEGMILQQDDCQVLEQKIWCIIEFFHQVVCSVLTHPYIVLTSISANQHAEIP